MAMFLSRLKQILNFQSKTVTATTSQQVVTPDQGYDGLEQVTVNPQVHTQTYTPADNTAANDMGVNNNYRYVDTSGMYTPTSITPSNSSPAALTANSVVTPTANGYAIESYGGIGPISTPTTIYNGEIIQVVANDGVVVDSITNVTPSSTPTSVASGDNIHIGGSGVIVDSIPTPTSITPSNSNPAELLAHVSVTPTDYGYAIQNYATVYPTSMPSVKPSGFIKLNSTAWIVDNMTRLYPLSYPQPLSSGTTYYCEGDAQYVYEIDTATPSDITPDTLLIDKTYYMNNTGYLYASSGLKDVPTYFSGISATTNNSSGTNSVSVTSGKKYLLVAIRVSTSSASNCSITSGATVNKTYVNNTTFSGSKGKLYAVMCTATSSTITVAGTNNILSVLPLNSGEEPTDTLPPMNVTIHHGSASASNYAIVDNIGYTKLKLVSSTAKTSAGNQYAIDNGSFTSVSVGSTVSIPSAGQVKLYLNRTGENTAVWQFSN